MKKDKPELGKRQERHLLLRADGATKVDLAARTVRFPFSSEDPVDMWYGTEILSHAKGAMRQSARQESMPLLYNHDRNQLLGIVESIEIDASAKRGFCTVRFGKDDLGAWAMEQVADGILVNASFAYRVFEFVTDVDNDIYTATDWEAYEISLVTVPADASVGVGRSAATLAAAVEDPPDPAAPVTEQPASAGFLLPAEKRAQEVPQQQAVQPAAQAAISGETTMRTRHLKQDQATDGTGGSAGGAAVVDINSVRVAAQVEERARVTEIEAMCRAHGIENTVRDKLVADGTSIESARGAVLLDLQKRGNKQTALSSVSDDIGLTDQEKRSYSLMRAINAVVNNNWAAAGFEREVSNEIAKRNQREGAGTSFFFPNDLPFAPSEAHRQAYRMMTRTMNRAMGERAIYQVGTPGTGTTGGTLVATQLLADSFIEVLRNQSVTAQLGAMMLPGLVGAVDIPRQTAATAVFWVGESGAVTEAEGTFDKVSLRPKTIGALSKVSRLMLLQSTPAIEMLIRNDLARVGALGIDLAAISGSGSANQPTGIVNQAGVGSVVGGTNGANLTFDNIIQLQYATKIANAPQANTGYALNSKCIGYLSTQKATTGQYLWDPQGGLTNSSPDRLKGRAYAESQQLRATLTKGTSAGICSELVYGNWQELIIGEWGITEIAVNPYDSTGFTTGDVILRMLQTIDIGVRHGASFAVMSDALTPGF